MPNRPFLRAVLAGGAVILALILAVAAWRLLDPPVPDPVPANDFNPAQFVRSRANLDAPFVATDYEVVDAMLAMAEVRPGDVVIDLGSGDGRILIAAARSHGARGLGVDIDPARVREAIANAAAARVSNRVQFRQQDLFQTPLAEADVLTLYLTSEVNLRLRPRILSQMRPGTRVVSHDFDMGEWRADSRQRVGSAMLYLWVVPSRAEGQWTLTTEAGTSTLDLQQVFQQLSGTVQTGGRSSRVEQGRMKGDLIHFIADAGNGRQVYEGRIVDDRIEPLDRGAGWRATRAG